MTENQRDYLADLAGRKGVRLFDTDNWTVAQASETIDDLKSMPDASFAVPTEEVDATIAKKTDAVLAELRRWGFVRSTQ